MKPRILQLCFISSLAIFGTQCFSNSNQTEQPLSSTPSNENSTFTSAKAGASDNSKPPINSNYSPKASTGARVEGNTSEIKIDKLDLDIVLNQSAPEVWFVFDCKDYIKAIKAKCTDDKLKSELPPEAKPLIEEFWKETLTMFYKFYPVQNFDEADNLGSQHQKLMKDLEEKLVEFTINAPEGKRKLTYQEGDFFISYILEQAKPIRERIAQLKAEQLKN